MDISRSGALEPEEEAADEPRANGERCAKHREPRRNRLETLLCTRERVIECCPLDVKQTLVVEICYHCQLYSNDRDGDFGKFLYGEASDAACERAPAERYSEIAERSFESYHVSSSFASRWRVLIFRRSIDHERLAIVFHSHSSLILLC